MRVGTQANAFLLFVQAILSRPSGMKYVSISGDTVALPVAVTRVQSKKDLRAFVDFPYKLYADNHNWVPPLRRDVYHLLDPDKNAFFEHGAIQPFLARDAAGNVVGRIAAVHNGMHLKRYEDGVGFFGFFETLECYEVAEALFDAAAAWLRDLQLTTMRGPASPSLNDTAGLLVEGFDVQPSILMPYNAPYYEDFLMRYGFTRAITMFSYYVHKKYMDADKLRRGVALVKRRYPNLTIRALDPKRFKEDVTTAMEIYNEGWADNWGFVPYTEAEAQKLASDLKQILEPDLFLFAEDEGVPVAFSVLLPDLNQALVHIRDGRLAPFGLAKILAYAKSGAIYNSRMPLMGVKPSHKGKGIDGMLVLETIDRGVPKGYDSCELSWILESNTRMRNFLDNLGTAIDKHYAMLDKALA